MIVIGIGSACQVAHQLRRLNLLSETLFFDWLVTTHECFIKNVHLQVEDSLFKEGYTLPETGHYLIENSTGLSFYPHDFRGLAEKDRTLIDEQVEGVRQQYLRRAERTRRSFGSGDVLVVRHFFEEASDVLQKRQDEIVSALSDAYPQTKFEFLWGSDFLLEKQDLTHGFVHHLPKSETWHGTDAAWDLAVEKSSLTI